MAAESRPWVCATLPPALGGREAHVWRADLDDPRRDLDELRASLTQDELERAGRYVFQRDRDRFVAARGLLRAVLAAYAGAAPSALRFGYAAHGKPFLLGPAGGELQFNLSHSQRLALIAVSRRSRIGVDIEHMRASLAYEQVAADVFSAAEQAALRSLPEHQRRAAFFACWTRKEAYVKAHGDGLAIPLDQFDVSLRPHEPAALLRAHGGAAHGRWTIHALEPASGYAAALAVEEQLTRLQLIDVPLMTPAPLG